MRQNVFVPVFLFVDLLKASFPEVHDSFAYLVIDFSRPIRPEGVDDFSDLILLTILKSFFKEAIFIGEELPAIHVRDGNVPDNSWKDVSILEFECKSSREVAIQFQ
jgi:hypothetical protein